MRRPRLAITRAHRGPAIALGYAAFCLVYLGAPHLSWKPPAVLAPTALDQAIPFLPWTILVYLGQFPFLFFTLWGGTGDGARTRTFAGLAAATLLATAVFVAWPTTGTRPDPRRAGAWAPLYRLVHRVDVPTNWLPSLHVALAWVAVGGYAGRGPRSRRLAQAGAAAITLSTLTTGQHVLVDVAGGLLVAGLARGIVEAGRRPMAGSPSNARSVQPTVSTSTPISGDWSCQAGRTTGSAVIRGPAALTAPGARGRVPP